MTWRHINWLRYLTNLHYINGLVQDCSNSSALAMELLQSCTKPLIYNKEQDIYKILKLTQSMLNKVVLVEQISEKKKEKDIYIQWKYLRIHVTFFHIKWALVVEAENKNMLNLQNNSAIINTMGLLIISWCEEPGHQQAWYWALWFGISQPIGY